METKVLNDNIQNEGLGGKSQNEGMLPVGTMLCHDKYRIVRHIASGGFGNTYEVVDTAFNAKFVVKELFVKGDNHREGDSRTVTVSNPDRRQIFETCRRRFGKEAKRLFQLRNEHIVRVYDLFEENGTDYYVMDFVEGVPLSAIIRKRGKPLTEKQTQQVMTQMVDALETVHKEGIWHLDIKPSNIMVDKSGKCVLIDFGASKQTDVDGASTTSTSMAYTPGYAPVEQTGGSRDSWGPWTDFYALGATAYNIITGNRPPLTDEILTKGENAFDFPTNVSQGMQKYIVTMMQVAYNKRPQNVDEVRQLMNDSDNLEDDSETLAADTDTLATDNGDLGKTKTADEAATRVAGKDNGPKNRKSKKKLLVVVTTIVAAICFVGWMMYYLKSNAERREQEKLIEPIETFTQNMINAETLESKLYYIQQYGNLADKIKNDFGDKEPIPELNIALGRAKDVYDSISIVIAIEAQRNDSLKYHSNDSLQPQM